MHVMEGRAKLYNPNVPALPSPTLTPSDAESIEAPTSALGSNGTIAMQLYGRIREDIINSTLAPGLKLKIEEICRRYDAGSSPIREALNLLTSFGLVERIDNRGFRVRTISVAEYSDLLRVRCWVEERALREATARGGSEWEDGIALALFRLKRVGKIQVQGGQKRSAVWIEAHRDFHHALLAGCGSPMLLDYCAQLFDQNIRYSQIAHGLSQSARDNQAEHDEIADAALDRDADGAVALLLQHYRMTGKYVSTHLFGVDIESI